jgi:hypothetical protein
MIRADVTGVEMLDTQIDDQLQRIERATHLGICAAIVVIGRELRKRNHLAASDVLLYSMDEIIRDAENYAKDQQCPTTPQS